MAKTSSRGRKLTRSKRHMAVLVVGTIVFLFLLSTLAIASPYFEEGINYGSPFYANTYICTGTMSYNKVQDSACHKYCIIKHLNSNYVVDCWHSSPSWIEMGWMWDKTWAQPRWFVDDVERSGQEMFWLLGTVNANTWVSEKLAGFGYSGYNNGYDWKAYTNNHLIWQGGGFSTEWGYSAVSGEKWHPYETNTSDWMSLASKGCLASGNYNTWVAWSNNVRWGGNDPRYVYKPSFWDARNATIRLR